jgi:hypothetical protein
MGGRLVVPDQPTEPLRPSRERPPIAGSILLGCLTGGTVIILLATAAADRAPWLPALTTRGDRLIVIGLAVGLCAAVTALLCYLRQATDTIALAMSAVTALTGAAALAATATRDAWAEQPGPERFPHRSITARQPGDGAPGTAVIAIASGTGAGSRAPTQSTQPRRAPAATPSPTSDTPAGDPAPAGSRPRPPANGYRSDQPFLLVSDTLTTANPAWRALPAAGRCEFDRQGLRVSAAPPGQPDAPAPTTACHNPIRLADATVELEFTMAATQAAGLAVRVAGEAGYLATVTSEGTVTLAARAQGRAIPLAPARTVAGFRPGAWHVLAVAMAGGALSVHLDHKPIVAVTGTSAGTGTVAVVATGSIAADDPDGRAAQCRFRNLRVWGESRGE